MAGQVPGGERKGLPFALLALCAVGCILHAPKIKANGSPHLLPSRLFGTGPSPVLQVDVQPDDARPPRRTDYGGQIWGHALCLPGPSQR